MEARDSILKDLIIFILLNTSLAAIEEHRIDKIPGINIPADLEQYSGHIQVEFGNSFYWFVKSAAERDEENIPLVLWLNGGPGCSSIGSGLFTENGPFLMDLVSEEAKVIENPYSWHKLAHMLYLDAPPGTGYSYANVGVNITDHEEVTSDMYLALKLFLANYTEYSGNDFYIFGQSFAGVYIPILVDKILDGKDINIKGFAIGGGYHHDFLTEYAQFEMASFVSMLNLRYMEKIMPVCCKGSGAQTNSDCAIKLAKNKNSDLSQMCLSLMRQSLGQFNEKSGSINWYNILERCYYDQDAHYTYTPCAMYSRIEQFLNKDDVRQALHVERHAPNPYELCKINQRGSTHGIKYNYSEIDMSPYYHKFFSRLEKPKMMLYHGDQDWVIPPRTGELFSYMINENLHVPPPKDGAVTEEHNLTDWLLAIKDYTNSTFFTEFLNLTSDLALTGNPFVPWTYQDKWGPQIGGQSISFPQNNYTYTTVRGAGHAVPTDKPLVALTLFCKFIRGETFDNLDKFEPGSCSHNIMNIGKLTTQNSAPIVQTKAKNLATAIMLLKAIN